MLASLVYYLAKKFLSLLQFAREMIKKYPWLKDDYMYSLYMRNENKK